MATPEVVDPQLYVCGAPRIATLQLPDAELSVTLNEVESHFFAPGEEVRGSVSLRLAGPLSVKSVELTLHAEATLTMGGSTHTEILFRDKHRVLSKPVGEGMLELEAKTHEGNFQIRLPQDAPPSVMSRAPDGQYLFAIRYYATAVLYQSGYAAEMQNRVLQPVLATSHELLVHRPPPPGLLAAAARAVSYSMTGSAKLKNLSAELQLTREFYQMGECVQGVLIFNEKSKLPKEVRFSLELQLTLGSGGAYKQQLTSSGLAPSKQQARQGIALALLVPQSVIPTRFGCAVHLASANYFLRVHMDFGVMGGRSTTMYPVQILPSRDLAAIRLQIPQGSL